MAFLVRGKRRLAWILLFLAVIGMAAQMCSFHAFRPPDATAIAATAVPHGYPAGYTPSDLARAHAFDRGMLLGALARSFTLVFVILTLIASGFALNAGSEPADRIRFWLRNIAFLAGLYIVLRIAEAPYIWGRYAHCRAFDLTPMTPAGLGAVLLLATPAPLAAFVLKCLLVICTLPLFKKRWWIAACLLIFFLTDIAPEVVSRTYPLDPVRTLSPLQPGPHADSMQAAMDRAGASMPLMSVDESKRSNTANVYIAGRHGREYVVITDTFLEQYSPSQAALALAHELGHYRHRYESMLIDKTISFLLLAMCFGLAYLFTGRSVLPVSSGLHAVLVVTICLSISGMILRPASNVLLRRLELRADREAVRLIPEPQQYADLLVGMAKHDLEPLEMPRWKKALFSSYPSVMERIRGIAPAKH